MTVKQGQECVSCVSLFLPTSPHIRQEPPLHKFSLQIFSRVPKDRSAQYSIPLPLQACNFC